MRLIDADYFKEQIAAATLKGNADPDKGLALMELVDALPTSYDVDKVFEQLEKKKEAALELCDNNARYDAYCKAIEIVKSGGVERRKNNV